MPRPKRRAAGCPAKRLAEVPEGDYGRRLLAHRSPKKAGHSAGRSAALDVRTDPAGVAWQARYEANIRRLQERAAQRLPLFDGRRPEAEGDDE